MENKTYHVFFATETYKTMTKVSAKSKEEAAEIVSKYEECVKVESVIGPIG